MKTNAHGKLQLFSAPLSMFGMKVIIAAHEKGLEFDLTMVPYSATGGYSPKHPEVLRVNPKRQVPILIHGEVEIFDSTQIFEYLEDLQPNPALWPLDISARAKARLLEHQSDEVYFPLIIRLMGLQQNMQDPVAIAARESAAHYFNSMEGLLARRAYLAETFSFADIAFYMAQLFGERMGVPMTESSPNLLKWRDQMTERPSVRKAVKPMVLYLLENKRPVPAFLHGVLLGE